MTPRPDRRWAALGDPEDAAPLPRRGLPLEAYLPTDPDPPEWVILAANQMGATTKRTEFSSPLRRFPVLTTFEDDNGRILCTYVHTTDAFHRYALQ